METEYQRQVTKIQKKKQTLGGKKNKVRQFKSRKERGGDWGFDDVMFVFCLPERYSLVFVDERHQLELNV